MSLLRPARTVTAPDGRVWEIYVSRVKPPSSKPSDRSPPSRDEGVTRELRVEAVCFFPWPESHLWLTTKDHLARVVEQVAVGLGAGQVALPLGAEFKGSQEMVASTFRGLHRDG